MKCMRAGFGLGLLLITAGPIPVRAQPDTLRPPRAAELHAQRRAWLEVRRTGALSGNAVEYGSAVVGAPGVAAGPGAAYAGPGGYLPGAPVLPGGGIPVVCRGVVYGGFMGPTTLHGASPTTFQGNCQPLHGSPQGPWQGPGPSPIGPVPSESYWNGWGWTPTYPFGWGAGGGAAWQFAWPGGYADECVLLRVAPAGAPSFEIPVGLRSLGTADARDLDLAVEARLARGMAVDLHGLDGRWVRLPPGTLLDDVTVRPCPTR